jgi:hypothetical protein
VNQATTPRIVSLIATSLVVCAAATTANASEFSSNYSRYVEEKCDEKVNVYDTSDHQGYRCTGKNGVPVIFNPQGHRAAVLGFEPYLNKGMYWGENPSANWITYGHEWPKAKTNDKGEVTFEWRVKQVNKEWIPFASIVRFKSNYYVGDTAGNGQEYRAEEYLVVTKLGDNDSCIVGTIHTNGNPNANEEARELADTHVENFDCSKDAPLHAPWPNER